MRSATLYAVHSSHSAHTARLMLEYKGIEHKLVNLVPGTHAAVLRLVGFRSGTVPALKLHGRRLQGSRAISRALDAAHPEPPLFPADPQERTRVEAAERWGEEVLQPVPRRLGGWITIRRPELRIRLAREAGVPAARLLGRVNWPIAWYFARKHGGYDADLVRRTAASLPELFDHVEELLDEGTIGGGGERNAADFQIGTSVRLLMSFEDLEPALRDREAGRFAMELMPDYPTGVPAGLCPREWLEPLGAGRL